MFSYTSVSRLYSLFFLLLVVLAASSCAVTTRHATTHTGAITPAPIVQHKLAVDLDIEEVKVEGKFEGTNVQTEYAKNMAISDALVKSGADVLVEPYFLVEITGSKTSVTVKGYPAKYKNFREPTLTDSILLGLKAPIATAQDTVLHTIQLKTATGGVSVAPSSPNLLQVPNQVSASQVNKQLLNNQSYLKLKRKAKTQMVIGSAFIITGSVVAIFGRNIYEDNPRIWTLSMASGLAFTGGIVLPIGISNKISAQKMQRQGNFNLALAPKLNIPDRSVQMGLTLNF